MKQERFRVGLLGYTLGIITLTLGLHALLYHGDLWWGLGLCITGAGVCVMTYERIVDMTHECTPPSPRSPGPSDTTHEG